MARIIKVLGNRLGLAAHGTDKVRSDTDWILVVNYNFYQTSLSHHQGKWEFSKFGTIAVLPTSANVPITAFCLELQHALLATGTATKLTSADVLAAVGPRAFELSHEYRMNAMLGKTNRWCISDL